MDEEQLEMEEKQSYQPRPVWQVVLAWIGVGIMAVSIALYYWQIATGGLG